MLESGREVLADLYGAARYSYERRTLDGLVVKAELGWRCQAALPDDGNRRCEYLNVPDLTTKSEDRCQNCAASRKD